MAIVGTGTTITFASGFFAEILSVSGPSATRKSIETSHMGTSDAHTFTPGRLVDWGEVELEIAFDPGTLPPIDSDPETCTITFPTDGSSGGESWEGMAFMTNFSVEDPLEERMTASATLKITGSVALGGSV